MVIIRRFFRNIKEGFIGVKRHFGMAISSASAVTIALFLVGTFAVFAYNLSFLSQEIEQTISLTALVDYNVESISAINTLKSNIEKLEHVDSVVYSSKDEEFDFYNETYPDMVEFSEIYREDNPFHDAFIVYLDDGTNLEDVKNQISRMPGISSVEDGGSYTYTFVNLLHAVRNVGGVVIIALVALAVYLIYNTIKITIANRKNEIWIMRNVGAKNSYIRSPFLVEGIIIGIIGSILPIGLIIYGYHKLYTSSGGVVAGLVTLIPIDPFIYYISIALLILGILVGYIGSYISVMKYLRLTR